MLLFAALSFMSASHALAEPNDGDTVHSMVAASPGFATPYDGPSTATGGYVRVVFVSYDGASAERHIERLRAAEQMKLEMLASYREPGDGSLHDYSGLPIHLIPKLQREDYGYRHKLIAPITERALHRQPSSRYAYARRGDHIRTVRAHC